MTVAGIAERHRTSLATGRSATEARRASARLVEAFQAGVEVRGGIADGDYIAARMACRAELVPQFLWSSQQAIEKYLKCTLLMHRVTAKVGHDIDAALKLTDKLPFELKLQEP